MTIYAISIASNLDRAQNTQLALTALQHLGSMIISNIYEIPCRDGVGADYWNCACLLESKYTMVEIQALLKQMEIDTGRKRPSHKISLDMDLIAWGETLTDMQFNPKKLPLAHDVIIPIQEIWALQTDKIVHHYPNFCPTILSSKNEFYSKIKV